MRDRRINGAGVDAHSAQCYGREPNKLMKSRNVDCQVVIYGINYLEEGSPIRCCLSQSRTQEVTEL